jgi:hypothetical protein
LAKDLNASDAPIFVGSALLAMIRAPPSAKETAMQIDCGTLRRALKNLVRLGPKQPKRPMLEHVLFEPTQNDVALTGRISPRRP